MEIHNGRQEAVMCVKERPYTGLFVNGLTTLDYERGKSPEIRPEPWQTDDTIGPWGYREGAKYKETNALVDKLVDIVSKNGNLLLNVTIKADGTLDEDCIKILEEMGEWFAVNGEAIYGTRPWYRFGEGKVNETPELGRTSLFTAKDIRFTTKDGNLYVIFMGWPEKRDNIRLRYITPSNADAGTVSSVTLLGHGPIQWQQDTTGLYVDLPDTAPTDFAHALEVTFK
jgi:alpha-L-fucosidase